MKKKGFTLIELLAVIVVLAVIAIIAVPTILGVVEKARRSALQDSAYGIIDAADLYYAQNNNTSNLMFNIDGSNITSNDTDKMISYKGNIKEGSLVLTSNGKVSICLYDGHNSVYKNVNDNNIIVISKKRCSINSSNNTIVYLDGEATQTELSNTELTEQLRQAQEDITNLKSQLNANKYSETEQVVGTWINGKPIYRKTYIFDGKYYANQNLPIDNLDYDNVWIGEKSYGIRNDDAIMPMPYVHSSTTALFGVLVSKTSIILRPGSEYTSSFYVKKLVLNFEYTKTTD